MQNRAYSFLRVKSIDDDQRIIRGMATTPEPDRVGDIVDPMGAQFKNPSPLLWMHKHDLPVGTVNFGKPTKEGIPFEARLPEVSQPAGLKARIDEAWESVKAGLVAAVSIGFRALEYAIIEETGGYRFTRTDIYELSLVTVPANAGATIQLLKSIDSEALAASGRQSLGRAKSHPSGVSEKAKPVKLMPKEGQMKISEQIKQYRDTLTQKNAKLVELAQKSAEEGATFDAADQEEFDTISQEVTELEGHIKRLEVAEKAEKAAVGTARPVSENAGLSEKAALDTRNPAFARVKANKPSTPGIQMARLAKCVGLAQGNMMQAEQIAINKYQDDEDVIKTLKAAVAAGTTLGNTWASPLVGDQSDVYADFVEFLRPQTILGKFGQGNVPSLRRVPFRTRLVGQTSGGNGYWVGEGKGKPVTKFDFNETILLPLKVANIAVVTDELLRDSSPSADILIRDQLVAALRERLDIDFIDPNKAAVNNVSPASITHGVTSIESQGVTEDDVRADIQALMATFIAANNAPSTGVWIMSATTALALSLMTNALGQSAFQGITMNGGSFWGMPVIVSEYLQGDTAGSYVALVNAGDVYLGDDGGFALDVSREASLQMDSAPTQDSGAPTATQVVSLWQTNSVGFRAERTINWAKRRNSAVALLSGVNWGAGA